MEDLQKREMLESLRQYADEISINIENKNSLIKDVIYLGDITWQDRINKEDRSESLYIVKKEITEINKDGKEEIKQICNYYLGQKCIGAYLEESEPYFSTQIEDDKLNLVKKLLEENKEKDINGISLNELENEQLEEIAIQVSKARGVKVTKEDIKNMAEIDINEENEKNKNKEEGQQLSKETTQKAVSNNQEIRIDAKVDDKKTIGQALDLNSSEYTKIGIVYTDKLEGKENSTRYSFVAIRKDGTSQIIDDKLDLDLSAGDNSTKEAVKVDANKTARKDNKTNSRFKIRGKDEYISVENGQYGEIKAYYGKGKTRDGNMSVETQLETTNVRPTSRELRRLQSDRRGNYATDRIADEAKETIGDSDKKVGIKSIDGDKNTVDTNEVDEISDNYVQKMVDELMENEEISNVFTRREIEERTVEFFEKQDDIEDMENLKEQLQEDLEIDAGHMHTRGERSN